MVTFDVFLLGLMITSTLTGLVTEAVKKILAERNVKCRAIALAGIVATILSIGIGIGYVLIADVGFTAKIVVCMCAQVFLSWLCAIVGYDKVIEIITKFKKGE